MDQTLAEAELDLVGQTTSAVGFEPGTSETDANASDLPELSSEAEAVLTSALSDEPQQANLGISAVPEVELEVSVPEKLTLTPDAFPAEMGVSASETQTWETDISPSAVVGTFESFADDVGISPSPAASTGFSAVPSSEQDPQNLSPATITGAESPSLIIAGADTSAALSTGPSSVPSSTGYEQLLDSSTFADTTPDGAEALEQPLLSSSTPLEAGDIVAADVVSDAALTDQAEGTIDAGVYRALQDDSSAIAGIALPCIYNGTPFPIPTNSFLNTSQQMRNAMHCCHGLLGEVTVLLMQNFQK